MTQADCEEVLRRVEIGVGLACDEVMGASRHTYRKSA